MKKIIGFLVVTAIFIGIGFAVNRYINGPSQPVNGIMVSGTKENISAVKNLYKDQNVRTTDYSYKLVTEIIKQEFTTEQKEEIKKEWKEKGGNMTEEEIDKELNKPSVTKKQYAVITKSTAEKFLKKGIIRTPLSKEDSSMISASVKEIKELAREKNIFYRKNAEDGEVKDGNLNLNGQMIPVQHIEQNNWIGYFSSPIVIVNEEAYKQLKEKEVSLSLIQFAKENFDYKNKNKVKKVVEYVSKVYAVKDENGEYDKDKIYFVEIQN
ncbi:MULTISPECIES: lipoprotein BA_5634 family protein [Bacillus]|uniref:lipoprotein BA_5634 family protein n=1 Tax=Bacillus TaxID=1386 RepID=UPI0002E0EB2C|nr:lipoprotein BA_5634 family protein [Bacillus cereus]WPA86001.1 lipoprotein BA_5634 family protein [Bacillus cereus]